MSYLCHPFASQALDHHPLGNVMKKAPQCASASAKMFWHNLQRIFTQYITIYSIIMYYLIISYIHDYTFIKMIQQYVLYEHTNSAHYTCPHMHVDAHVLYHIISIMCICICICCARNSDVAIGLFYYILTFLSSDSAGCHAGYLVDE